MAITPDWLTWNSPLSAEQVWGLVPRLVGLLYAIHFLSLRGQVLALVGSRGIAPLGPRLQRMARDYPGVRRFVDRPTVFWLHHGDGFLRAVPWIGVTGALFAMLGGELGPWGLLLCWVCNLSLDVCALWLPWDTMVFEAGFLALFLPAVPLLPDLAAVQLPLPSVVFLFQWLVIRLMIGFAKLKFRGTEPGDSMYLQGFLTWLPMPTPLGWFLQKAPAWVLRGMCGFMFVAEVVAPLLALFPGTPRLVGAVLLGMLMLGIGVTGNWGHFNVGYLMLLVCLLDSSFSVGDLVGVRGLFQGGLSQFAVDGTMVTLFLMSLVFFPFNSWVTQAWTQWNFEAGLRRRPWLRPALFLLRVLNHFRLVGSYGVFPPNSSPPIKMVPVLEGSRDGKDWRPYRFAFMPTREDSPPRFIAPHHPRLDHSSIYTGLGLTESDSVGGLMFELKPYGVSPYGTSSWIERLMQRVLEGEPSVLALLGDNPFPNQPPKWVRLTHQCLAPTSLAEWRRTGRWWHARSMGVLFPSRQSDPGLWDRWIAEPECLHPDLLDWRNRSPALRRVRAALAEGMPWRDALREGSDLTLAEVDTFWEEFVPFVADPSRLGRWDCLPHTVDQCRDRFTADQRHRFERIHQRCVYALQRKLGKVLFDPMSVAAVLSDTNSPWEESFDSDRPNASGDPTEAGTSEVRAEESYFHFQTALQALVFLGEERVQELWREPQKALQEVRRLTDAQRLYPTAVYRWEMVRFQIMTLRTRTELSRAPEMPFGIGKWKDFLLSLNVAEQWLPQCFRSPDGTWTVPVDQFHQGEAGEVEGMVERSNEPVLSGPDSD